MVVAFVHHVGASGRYYRQEILLVGPISSNHLN
jgi:hypothetical protein